VKFTQPVQQIVFQEYVDTATMLSQRVAALDKQLEAAAAESVLWTVIEALMAPRGVSLLTATTIDDQERRNPCWPRAPGNRNPITPRPIRSSAKLGKV
jgi:hypothetical protein